MMDTTTEIWIPAVGEWVCHGNSIGQVQQRFKNSQGKITLLIDGQKLPLEQCSKLSFETAYAHYIRLLERCAQLAEILDTLDPKNEV